MIKMPLDFVNFQMLTSSDLKENWEERIIGPYDKDHARLVLETYKNFFVVAVPIRLPVGPIPAPPGSTPARSIAQIINWYAKELCDHLDDGERVKRLGYALGSLLVFHLGIHLEEDDTIRIGTDNDAFNGGDPRLSPQKLDITMRRAKCYQDAAAAQAQLRPCVRFIEDLRREPDAIRNLIPSTDRGRVKVVCIPPRDDTSVPLPFQRDVFLQPDMFSGPTGQDLIWRTIDRAPYLDPKPQHRNTPLTQILSVCARCCTYDGGTLAGINTPQELIFYVVASVVPVWDLDGGIIIVDIRDENHDPYVTVVTEKVIREYEQNRFPGRPFSRYDDFICYPHADDRPRRGSIRMTTGDRLQSHFDMVDIHRVLDRLSEIASTDEELTRYIEHRLHRRHSRDRRW